MSWLRSQLTPGQRYTALLALALALGLLVAGRPTETTGPATFAAGPATGGGTFSAAPTSSAAVAAAPDVFAAVAPGAPVEDPPPAAPATPPVADEPPPAGGGEPSPTPLTCAADQGLPMPFFSMIVMALQQAEGALTDGAGMAPPASLAAAIATQAGCTGGTSEARAALAAADPLW